ncbi:hypothetical protein PUR30_01785, partial [Streptomyces sp. JV190]|nr:hypothetical protein [Streptomyces sp. JV190]
MQATTAAALSGAGQAGLSAAVPRRRSGLEPERAFAVLDPAPQQRTTHDRHHGPRRRPSHRVPRHLDPRPDVVRLPVE